MDQTIVNTQSVTTLLTRLEANVAQVKANHEKVVQLNKDLAVKALEEELERRKAIAAGVERENKPVYRFDVPCNCTCDFEEEIDRLKLITNTEVVEGDVPRHLLVPINEWKEEGQFKHTVSVCVKNA